MADKKSDLRVVRTRNALRAAFEELIAETTLDKITVKAPHRPGRHQPQNLLLALRDHRGLLRRNYERHHGRVLQYYEKTPDDPLGYGRSRPTFLSLSGRPASHD